MTLIKCKIHHLEQRAKQRGYALNEVMGCVQKTDKDYIYVDPNHPSYPNVIKRPRPKIDKAALEKHKEIKKLVSMTWQEKGPLMWAELHTKTDPSPDWMNKDFVPRIACGDCKNHFMKLLRENPPDYNSLEDWRRWTVKAHNIVNERLGKPQFTFEDAYNKWGWNISVAPKIEKHF